MAREDRASTCIKRLLLRLQSLELQPVISCLPISQAEISWSLQDWVGIFGPQVDWQLAGFCFAHPRLFAGGSELREDVTGHIVRKVPCGGGRLFILASIPRQHWQGTA